MNLYIVKKTPDSLMIYVVAANDARELRDWGYIQEVGDINGVDNRKYVVQLVVKGQRKFVQERLFGEG